MNVLVDRYGVRVLVDLPVIKADLAGAAGHATRLLAIIQEQIEAMRLAAMKQMETELEEHRSQAKAAAAVEMARVTASLCAKRAELERQLVPELAELAVHAVRELLKVESKVQLYQRAITQMQQTLSRRGDVVMVVHSVEREAASAALHACGPHELVSQMVVQTSDSVPPGDCVLRSNVGTVELRLDTQLDVVRQAAMALIGRLPHLPDDESGRRESSGSAGDASLAAHGSSDD